MPANGKEKIVKIDDIDKMRIVWHFKDGYPMPDDVKAAKNTVMAWTENVLEGPREFYHDYPGWGKEEKYVHFTDPRIRMPLWAFLVQPEGGPYAARISIWGNEKEPRRHPLVISYNGEKVENSWSEPMPDDLAEAVSVYIPWLRERDVAAEDVNRAILPCKTDAAIKKLRPDLIPFLVDPVADEKAKLNAIKGGAV